MVLSKFEIIELLKEDLESCVPVEEIVEPQIHGLMASMTKKGFAASHVEENLWDETALIIDPFNTENLNDDGIDFTIGNTIYASDILLSEQIFLEDLENLKKEGLARRIDLTEGEKFVFHPEVIYYVLSKEKVRISYSLKIGVDSKSTIGRLGCLCHDTTGYDLTRNPVNLIGVVRPYVFPLKVTARKSRLLQGIFRYKEGSHMTREQIIGNGDKISVIVDDRKGELEKILIEDKLPLHFSTHKAYVSKSAALRTGEAIDIEARGDDRADWRDYFDEIKGNGKIILEPGKFYLLGTKENISFENVCGRLSRDYGSHLTGLWSQFAGIIHVGFNGEITLECKTDRKRIIKDGDLAGTIELDALYPDYNIKGKGSYLGQNAPKLPKVFRED